MNLSHIDFDIEGFWVAEPASIERRSQAIAALQQSMASQNRPFSVWYTLPVLPSGLTADGLAVVDSALRNGVNLSGVNVMAMDYGDSAAPNPQNQMGEYAIQAANSLHQQLKALYSSHGQPLTDQALYQMIGITPMIGMNDVTTEIFNLEDAQQLVDFAQQHELGLVSMWSVNRDKECDGGATNYVSIICSSIEQDAFGFSSIFNQLNTVSPISDPTDPTDPIDPIDPSDPSGPGSDGGDGSAGGSDTPPGTNIGEFNEAYNNDTGSVVASYFVEWGVYGRNYHVNNMPAQNLTHVLYGFIAVCGPNESLRQANPSGHSILQNECSDQQDYTVTVYDRFAALEKSYPGDKWDDPIRGNFGQLAKMKQAHPHIKVLPSIGGWTLSDPFFDLANDAQLRQRFVDSAVQFLVDYPMFDGIDIDWEYPGGGGANDALGSTADKQGFALLMRDLRQGLNALSATTGRSYELTAAVGAGQSKIDNVDYSQAQQYMDYVFAMTYDFYGAWNGELGHMAGLHSLPNEIQPGFSGSAAINALIGAGVPANKLVLGVAFYGRGWTNVSGVEGDNPFTGIGGTAAPGTWEAGVLDYRAIEQNYMGGADGPGINGYAYGYDEQAEAAYVWNPSTKTLISFDSPRSAKAKGAYAKELGLAGVFSWEIDADNGHLLNAMHEGLGHTKQ
jgi:chitinase